MKITFKQSLTDISPRINAPLKADETEVQGRESFKALLRDISPFNSQPSHNTNDLKRFQEGPPGPGSDDSGPMASYRPPAAKMIEPNLGRLGGGVLGDNDPLDGVKTPTLLEAKRVRLPNPYQGLSLIERASEVQKLSSAYGYKYGIDPSLAMAVAETESSFNPEAVSSDGHESKGLFQLLDTTGKEMMSRINLDGDNKSYNPFDPDLNSELGISYLRYLHDLFNEQAKLSNGKKTIPAADSESLEKLAVAAYNAGEGRVSSAQHSAQKDGKNPGEYSHVEPYLPESTQRYVQKVDQIRARYAGPELEDS